MACLTRAEIDCMGFAAVGTNVSISDRASLYNCAGIALGSNVRIDDFCILSAGPGGIHIGNYVHIAAYVMLVGARRITLSDFSGLSSRVSIFSSSDDYSGKTLTNPTVPAAFTGVEHAEIFIGRHVIVGCGTVILPGAHLEEGVAVGALSVVNRRCEEFGIYSGSPARRIKARERDLLTLEHTLLNPSTE